VTKVQAIFNNYRNTLSLPSRQALSQSGWGFALRLESSATVFRACTTRLCVSFVRWLICENPPASSHRRVARRLRRRRPRPVPRGRTDAHRRAVGGVVSHRRARQIPRAVRLLLSPPRTPQKLAPTLPAPAPHLLCLPPPLSSCRRAILAGVGCGVMSTTGSAQRNI
jgi:hypothetical protein